MDAKKIFIISMLALLLTACSKEPEPETIYRSLFLKPSETVDFQVRNLDNSLMRQEKADSQYWTKIENIPDNSSMRIYYWNEKTYVNFITILELRQDYSVPPINVAWHKGNTTITSDDLKKGSLPVTISTNGLIQNPEMCLEHSTKILGINVPEQEQSCTFNWYNHSSYVIDEKDAERKDRIYQWLPENQYRCSNNPEKIKPLDGIRTCKSTQGRECILADIPKQNYDKCIQLPTINNENYTINLDIETIATLTDKDFLKIDLFHHDRSPQQLRPDGIWALSKKENIASLTIR